MKVKIPSLVCQRCGHKWIPRNTNVLLCPNCKTPHWDEKREKNSLYMNRWYQKRGDLVQAKWRQKIKIEVLTHYGKGTCACVQCGFNDIRALSIDHIERNGAEHRRKLNKAGYKFYLWLRKQGFPEGYQTLCMNCQFTKEMPTTNV